MEEASKNNETAQLGIAAVMPLLPFKVKSITVLNTGLSDHDVESVLWINEKRIGIKNGVECICDDGYGGTCLSITNEFDWSFKERDFLAAPYVLIILRSKV